MSTGETEDCCIQPRRGRQYQKSRDWKALITFLRTDRRSKTQSPRHSDQSATKTDRQRKPGQELRSVDAKQHDVLPELHRVEVMTSGIRRKISWRAPRAILRPPHRSDRIGDQEPKISWWVSQFTTRERTDSTRRLCITPRAFAQNITMAFLPST